MTLTDKEGGLNREEEYVREKENLRIKQKSQTYSFDQKVL